MPPPPAGVPNPFSLADIKKLEKHLVKAGFSDVHIETVNVTFEFASEEDYSQYCQAVSAPARIALSKETEERKETIWRKVAEEAPKLQRRPIMNIDYNIHTESNVANPSATTTRNQQLGS